MEVVPGRAGRREQGADRDADVNNVVRYGPLDGDRFDEQGCFRLLALRTHEAHDGQSENLGQEVPGRDPVKSVSRIASRAAVEEKTKRRALEILTKAHQKEIVAGKDPMGLAAAALYVASTLEGNGKTQKDIADAASITEVTLRNRYKGLRQALGI